MLFDSLLMAAVASEIRVLRDLSLRDIEQNDDEGRAISFHFRHATLLLDTHPQRAHCYFSSEKSSTRSEEKTLTPFVQSLRKELRGARLVQISQPDFDRVLRLVFLNRNALGDDVTTILMIELMERRSNLILLDNDELIMDALKRLPPFLNRERTILPNIRYRLPPTNGENPLSVTNWRHRVLDARVASSDQFIRWLRHNFNGVSPLVARHFEAILGADFDEEKAAALCETFWQRAMEAARGHFTPVLCEPNQPYPLPISEICQARAQTLSSLLEECARNEAESQQWQSRQSALLSFLNKRLKSNAAQRADLARSELHAQDAERFKTIGNAMLTCLVEVENALSEKRKTFVLQGKDGETFTIELELDWNASDNAQRFFNRYRRALKLRGNTPQRHRVLEAERVELESWRAKVANATSSEEVGNLASECAFEQNNVGKTVSRTRQQEASARPESKLRQREIDGWQVWMGRSALENQILLSKVARPSDIWLHVRDAPSAHVLVKNQKGQEPPLRVIEEAARWLANVSRKGKSGETLEIIYTPAKWVRAIKGAPGRVVLGRFQTLLITT